MAIYAIFHLKFFLDRSDFQKACRLFKAEGKNSKPYNSASEEKAGVKEMALYLIGCDTATYDKKEYPRLLGQGQRPTPPLLHQFLPWQSSNRAASG
jgi:hypothetical protein